MNNRQNTAIGQAGRNLAALCLGTVVFGLSTFATGAAQPEKFVAGEAVVVAGGTLSTWARVNGGGKVIWAGFTVPMSLVENPPGPGSGPAGAIAALNFPAVVQQTTYLNHAEVQFNLHGHAANPRYADVHRYQAPHFDFHFYHLSVAQVLTIPFVPPSPLLPQVPAPRLPAGYAQPEFSVPQMGRHSSPLSEFTAIDLWEATMVSGFLPDASLMHFIEPMLTRDFLLKRQSFTLPIPMPNVLGKTTLYPSEFVAHYDQDQDAYHFVFKGFEPIQ